MRYVLIIVFVLRLRLLLNNAQQWLVERDARRSAVPRFATADDAVRYVSSKFEWREDKLKGWIPLDWSSDPEVFQSRLERGVPSGDCDDYHAWVCAALAQIPAVTDIVRLSVWTWTNGHTTCLYREDGVLYLVDYEIYPVAHIQQAITHICEKYGYDEMKARWIVETPDLKRLVATTPDPGDELPWDNA